MREELRRSIEILRDLDVNITNQAKQGGNNGTGERMAFDVSASDAREDVVVVLRSAAQLADPQARFRYDERPAHLVARAWHLPGFQQLCRSPQVHIVAQDLHDALVAAGRVLEPAEERRVLGACECGEFVVTRRDEGLARCRRCGAEYDIEAWDEGRAQLAVEARGQVGTLPELAVFLTRSLKVPVTARTLQRWAAREVIRPFVEGKPALYRIGDVLDAWEAERERSEGLRV
ncbi:hypothetical protein [Kocuria sp. CCUG 69068]|uniref:hypothetical protein n=1 Tax=Kocuria sp. CCUG 69068 TaxID=2043138 RepID=UPI00272E214B